MSSISLPLDNYPVYALVSNEEIDLLKGVMEYDDIVHKRRMWYGIYSDTFYNGGRGSYPAVEFNLDREIIPNSREPMTPEFYFRLFTFVE